MGKHLSRRKFCCILYFVCVCKKIKRKAGADQAVQFEGFLGNLSAKQQVAHGMTGDQIRHAWLIEGPIGSGRRTLARCMAQAAVCTAQTERPCGQCAGCRKAASGIHPDIFEFSRELDDKAFSADSIRRLREKVYVRPNEAPRQVFILADVQQMQETAQNTLLKILEEPPATAVFILTCENRSQVLSTVLSRVSAVALGGVDVDTAVQALRQKFPGRAEQELRQAAELFGGIIGQAEQGLTDGGTQKVIDGVKAVAAALVEHDAMPLLRATGAFEKDKDAMRGVIAGLQRLTRDALALRYGGTTMLSPFPEQARQWSGRFSGGQLLAVAQQLEYLQYALEGYMNYTLFLTLFCARLRQAATTV